MPLRSIVKQQPHRRNISWLLSYLLSGVFIASSCFAVLPATQVQAASNYLFIHDDPDTPYTSTMKKSIYVGGNKVNFDYSIDGRDNGISGTWTSSKPNYVSVGSTGICRGVGNGTSTITFKYKLKGTTYKLQTKVKSRTRAGSVAIATSGGETASVTLDAGATVQIKDTITPIAKARKKNPTIKSTYKTYYTLYDDSLCKTPADGTIATVDSTGLVTGVAEGTVFLRGTAKNASTSTTYTVDSNVIEIHVKAAAVTATTPTPTAAGVTATQQGANSILVVSDTDIQSIIVKNESGILLAQATGSPMIAPTKRRALITTSMSLLVGTYVVYVNGSATGTTVTCEMARVASFTLGSTSAAVVPGMKSSDGYPMAMITYSLKDQFGNDLTYSPNYPASSITAVMGIATVTGTTQGVLYIPIINIDAKTGTVTTKSYILGTTYPLTIVSAKTGHTIKETVTLVSPSTINSVTLDGIYQYTGNISSRYAKITAGKYYDLTATDYVYYDDATFDHIEYGYMKMADSNFCNIKVGSILTNYGGSVASTTTVGAYYLLLKATDQYGNVMHHSGITNASAGVNIASSGTGLALGSTTSLNSITMNGESYLVFPLNSATIVGGTANIVALTSYLSLALTDSTGISRFNVYATSTSYAGQPSYLTYTILNNSGSAITDYDTLVTLTNGISSGTAAGSTAYISDTSIISSDYSSSFWWEKQKDGTALLKYVPSGSVLMQTGSYLSTGSDVIQLLKGSTNATKMNIVVQAYTIQ